MIATDYKTLEIDGIEVKYILSNNPHELSESQYDKIRFKDMHLMYARFRIAGKEYYYEVLITNEMLADAPFVDKFIEQMVSKEIKKIKHEKTIF